MAGEVYAVASDAAARRVAQVAAQLSRLRLRPDDEEALRFFFNDFEAACGVRSSHGAQVEALLNPRSGAPAPTTIVVDGVKCPVAIQERWVLDRPKRQRDRVHAVYRAIGRMHEDGEGKLVVVLWRMYGPKDPNAPYVTIGELAPLAHYTATARALGARATARLRKERGFGPEEGFVVEPRQALLDELRRRDARPGELDELRRQVRREAERLLIAASARFSRELRP